MAIFCLKIFGACGWLNGVITGKSKNFATKYYYEL